MLPLMSQGRVGKEEAENWQKECLGTSHSPPSSVAALGDERQKF